MFFDLLKTIYQKEKLAIAYDTSSILGLNKVLSKEEDNIQVLKKLIPFMFYISAEHFFYLLYFTIPQKAFVPKTFKTEKEEDKENHLIDRIQYTLGWSKRELQYNRRILDLQLINNETYWKQQLGVKK